MFARKGLLILGLIFTFVLIDVIDADAQRRRRKTRDVEQETVNVPISERIWHSIELGNFGFGNGFSISGKYSAGFKFFDRLHVGPTGKFFYNFIEQFGDDDSFFDYGFGALARGFITKNIYLQGEYDYFNLDLGGSRTTEFSPLIGGGYHEGRGPWTFGLNILFVLNNDVRDITGNTVEYWLSFNYNF